MVDPYRLIKPQDGSHVLLRHFDIALTSVSDIIDTLPWSHEDKNRVMISVESYLVDARDQPMMILNKAEICGWLGERVGAEFVALRENSKVTVK